jgi:hypothetical protein
VKGIRHGDVVERSGDVELPQRAKFYVTPLRLSAFPFQSNHDGIDVLLGIDQKLAMI